MIDRVLSVPADRHEPGVLRPAQVHRQITPVALPPPQDEIRAAVTLVVKLLADEDLKKLEDISGGRHMTAEAMRAVLQGYDAGTVQRLLADDTNTADVRFLDGSKPRRWHVIQPLVTLSDGRCLLAVEMTLEEADERPLRIAIDDLHELWQRRYLTVAQSGGER